jgi:hypothetical protein
VRKKSQSKRRVESILDRTYTADSLICIGTGGPLELQVAGLAWKVLYGPDAV